MNEKDKALKTLYRALTVAVWAGIAYGLIYGLVCLPCFAG